MKLSLILVIAAAFLMGSANASVTTSTNNAGYTVKSNNKVRQVFGSIKAAADNWWAFPWFNFDSDVNARLIPVGDFDGAWGVFGGLVAPFRNRNRRPIFRRIDAVHELWNIDSLDGSVEFTYAVEGRLHNKLPTEGAKRVNITYQGTAQYGDNGRITNMHLSILNLNEAIISGGATERDELIDMICTNERSCRRSQRVHRKKEDCVAALQNVDIGRWGAVGVQDSLICRAWYSTLISWNREYCAAVDAAANSVCAAKPYDAQWTNIGDFYGIDESEIPLIPGRDTIPGFTAFSPPKTGTCDAACRAQLEATVSLLYSHTLWPTAALVMQGLTEFEGLFSATSKGRITPAGTFDDIELNKEYFAGLVSTPNSRADRGFIMLNKATENFQVIAHYIIELAAQPATDESPIPRPATNLSEMIVFQFDSEGRIESYDGSLSELESSVSNTAYLTRGLAAYPYLEQLFGAITVDMMNLGVIQQVCTVQAYYCTAAAVPQWGSFEECFGDLSQRRFGSWDDSQLHNNVVCRLLHVLLVPIRPDVHCPHVGPTGGGKCVDTDPMSWHAWKFDGSLDATVAYAANSPDSDSATGIVASDIAAGNTAVIVGAVVGAVCATLLLAAGLFTYVRRSSKESAGRVGNTRSMSIAEHFVYHRRSSSKEDLVVSPSAVKEGTVDAASLSGVAATETGDA